MFGIKKDQNDIMHLYIFSKQVKQIRCCTEDIFVFNLKSLEINIPSWKRERIMQFATQD